MLDRRVVIGPPKEPACQRHAQTGDVQVVLDVVGERLRFDVCNQIAQRRFGQPVVRARDRRRRFERQPDGVPPCDRGTELEGVVDLLAVAPARSQQEYILTKPREALRQARAETGWAWDPRLSRTGNRVARRLADVLECLGQLESWLRSQGRAGLTPCDRLVLTPAFARLARDAHGTAALADDFLGELHTHDRADAQ